jgi:hypothetical protein
MRCTWMALTLLLGCSSVESRSFPLTPTGNITADDYEDVLEQWTRRDEVYDKLYSVAFLHATYHSPAFRRAFLVRHPNVYGPGSEEASRLMLTRPEAENFHEFFVSVSTSNPKWNDLNRDDSIWQVTLTSDGGEPVDADVARVKTTANLRAIYPYITPYAKTYAVRFPRSTFTGQPVLTPKTKALELHVKSALGEASLVWRIASRGPGH